MSKLSNYYIFFLSLIFGFTVNSCSEIVDCIINRRPVLIDKELKTGVVDDFYSDYVWAEVKNDPDDDDYDYYFSISGSLPNGIDWYVEHRELFFEGTPLETGHFSFTVELFVDGDYYDGEEIRDPLCDDETSRVYTISIIDKS